MLVVMQLIKAELVLWTAGFVLMTLIINVPLLPLILRKTGLTKGALPLNSTTFWSEAGSLLTALLCMPCVFPSRQSKLCPAVQSRMASSACASERLEPWRTTRCPP